MTVQLSFRVEGMTCANCSGRVERVLKRIDGINEVNVNLATEKANITVDDGGPGVEELLEQVRVDDLKPLVEAKRLEEVVLETWAVRVKGWNPVGQLRFKTCDSLRVAVAVGEDHA